MGTAPESAVTLNPGPYPTSTEFDWRAAMQSTELSKRERRLRAAVVRIEERASELYPDAGDEVTRKWARVKRHAFVAGALYWRYKDQQFAGDGREMRRQQSERDKARNLLDAAKADGPAE